MSRRKMLVVALLASAGWAAPAFAQDGGAEPAAAASQPTAAADDSGVQEVIVTAQRREQRLQDVPIAITAVSSEQLEAIGATDVSDLNTVVPGLSIQAATGFLVPRIRGVGTTALGAGLENSVGLYVDGVYFASQTGSLLSLNNIERIEVLRGPQGTLFGRNATGGLIQIVTRTPSQDLVANASVGYANYDTFTADGYLSGGLSPNFAADIGVHYSTQGDGYGVNQFSGRDVNRVDSDFAVRSRLLITPSSATTINFTADYLPRNGSAFNSVHLVPGARAAGTGLTFTGRPWDVNSNIEPNVQLEGWGLSLRVDQEIGAVRLTSITAYRSGTTRTIFDADLTQAPASGVNILQDDEQVSQEVQLASNAQSRIQWVVGVYYFHATGGFDPAVVTTVLPFPPFAATLVTRDEVRTDSLAAYAQATLPLGSRTALTVGGRYTTEKRTLDGTSAGPPPTFAPLPFAYSRRFEAPTWRAALEHHVTDDVLLYASYNRGFKSGGFNAANPFSPSVQFRPEHLDAYELGFKSEWFDRRLRFNAAVFYYDYRNIQVSKFIAPAVNYVNGAGAEVYGLDVELQARVTRHLTLSAGLSLLHDRFTSYPDADFYLPLTTPPFGNAVVTGSAAGNRLPLTPDATFNINAHYERPSSAGTWIADLGYYYNSGWYGQPDNVLHQGDYDRIDAALGWRSSNDRFSVRIWGKNLGNRAVASALVSSNTGSQVQYEAPRTYGITLGTSFR